MTKKNTITRYLRAEDNWWVAAPLGKNISMDIQFDPQNAASGIPNIIAHVYVFKGEPRNRNWESPPLITIPAAVRWVNSILAGLASGYRVAIKKESGK